METLLLRTKFYIPSPPAELVSRPRLFKQLNTGVENRLTLIAAPAGFGKTALVAEWLRHADTTNGAQPSSLVLPNLSNVVWISLDGNDNDLIHFWTYIISALETLQDGVGSRALSLLHSPQLPPTETILTLLINDLTAIDNHFVFVLDDYHLIKEQAIHTGITFLIDNMPPHMHIILISRADPPLPLARWRARRHLAEIRAQDLRFTVEETAAFLNQLMGLELSENDIKALEERTEGWIAGLQLAAISMQGRTDIESFVADFTGSHHYILDYLAEEILMPQPEDLQTFLMQTAILDKLSGPLCNAVTGRTDSQMILERLARSNLFITPLDEQRHWYRFHQLFVDLLRHQLKQDTAIMETVPALHRRAAGWYKQQGLIEQAITHTLFARDYKDMLSLIEANIKSLFQRGKLNYLLCWLDDLPDQYRYQNPMLTLAYTWLLFFNGKINESKRLLKEVEQKQGVDVNTFSGPADDSPQSHDIWGAILALNAQFALIQGQIPRVIELSHQALDYLPEDKAALLLRGLTRQNLGLAYWLQGNMQAADKILSEIDVTKQLGHSTAATVIGASNLAELRKLQGHLSQAAQLYRQILDSLTTDDIQFMLMAGIAHADLGHLLYEWNRLDEAAHHMQKAIELGKQGAGMRALGTGYRGLVQIHLARGNSDEADKQLQQLEQIVRDLELDLPLAMVEAMKIRLHIAKGNLDPVLHWVEKNKLSTDSNVESNHLFLYCDLVRAMIALDDLDTVEALLTRLLPIAQESNWVKGMIDLHMLHALALQAQNKTDQALSALQQSLALAEPEGYIRTFLDEGDPLAALLLNLFEAQQSKKITSPPSTEYVARLLNLFGIGGMVADEAQDSGTDQPIADPLTERELEVLQLIATGLSNQEIADELVVAKSTLKTHVQNLYGKLEVHSRMQAVAKAKELNLL